MAVTIVATVGSASANSYITLADAITALEARLNASAWESASTDTKNRALVEAQKELQVQQWKGSRTDSTQALEWPRQGVENPDAPDDADLGESGVPEYEDDAIPQRIIDAQVELAFQYVKAGTTDIAMPDPSAGVQSRRVDVIETSYFQHGRPTRGLARYPRVQALIEPLLAAGAGGLTVTRG